MARGKNGGQSGCPKCGKLFASANARMQHARDAHQQTQAQASNRGKRGVGRPSNRKAARSGVGVPMLPMTGTTPANMGLTKLISSTGVRLGITAHGNAWAHRVLHPNDDTTGGGLAIPDEAESLTCAIESRHSGVLSKPADLVADKNWDLQLVVLPCPDMPVVMRTRESGATEWNSWTAFSSSAGGFGPGIFQTQYQQPAIVIPGPVKYPEMLADASQFRQSFRGLTVVMNSNSLTDQGFVTAGQWGSKGENFLMQPKFGQVTDTIQEIDAILFEDVPTNPDELINKCPPAGQWEARKGIYMPMRFNDPVHLFNSGEGSEWAKAGSNLKSQLGKPIILVPSGTTDGVVNWPLHAVWRTQSAETPEARQLMCSAGAINQNLGCVFFSGIDPKASFVVKVRTGLELTANESSPLSKALTPAPMQDEVALKAAQSVAVRLPMVMEHKFNSLGLLAGLIGSVAKWVLPTVIPWLGGKIAGLFGAGSGVPST